MRVEGHHALSFAWKSERGLACANVSGARAASRALVKLVVFSNWTQFGTTKEEAVQRILTQRTADVAAAEAKPTPKAKKGKTAAIKTE